MLTLTTLLGAWWSISSRIMGRLIDFLLLIVLARLLTPADFGLTALALSLVMIVDVVLEVQLVQALTRLRAVTRSHLDSAFTIGILRGLFLFAVISVAAWPMAYIYDDSRLLPLVLVLAIAPVCRGIVSPNMVKFTKDISFRQFFIMEVSGKLAAGLASLLLVYAGAGYWAIAMNSVASALTTTIVSYLLAPYRPAFSLKDWHEFRELIGWLSFAQLVAALNWQLDRLLLGHYLSPSTLGQYTMASDIAVMPTQSLVGPAMSPLIAAFAKIEDDDRRLRSSYLKATRFTMMLAAPACIGIALSADILMFVLLGPNWTEASGYLRLIALTVAFNAYFQPLYAMLLTIKRTRIVFQVNCFELALRLAFVPVMIHFFSINGVIAARAGISVIMFVLSLLYARHFLRVGFVEQLRNLWKAVASCGVMVLFVVALRHNVDPLSLPPVVELALVGGTGASIYVLVLYALGVRIHTADVRFKEA